MAEIISNIYEQGYFKLGEVAEMLGVGRGTISAALHLAGVHIKKIGNSKIISAYDLAEFMDRDHITPANDTHKDEKDEAM